MASSEELANIVKGLHSDLRRQCWTNDGKDQQTDPDSIWNKHLEKETELASYSNAMKTLATQHWTKGPEQNSRIHWIHTKLKTYYTDQDCGRIARRLAKKAKMESSPWTPWTTDAKIHTLDVGSCFNPFSTYPDLDVLALDLAPADPSVKKCDFLNVPLSESLVLNATKDAILSLPSGAYDAVLFCLLLEYLPVPALRYRACAKARNVLREGGLLVLVTPDSCHQGRNLSVIRSWRIALARLGLIRVYYEKLEHVHGMAFVKVDPEAFKDVLEQDASGEAAKNAP